MTRSNLCSKVLIVDDEPMVRQLIATVLNHSGYDVVSASSAAQAMDLLERDSFQLLLTDIVMPGGDGCELASKVRQRMPTLRVLFMSGYGSIPGNRDCGDSALLMKPFRICELLTQVKRSLS